MQKTLINFLFFANIIDAIATDIGLRHAGITEANALIESIYDTSIFLYYTLKVGGVTLGLFILTTLQQRLAQSKLIHALLYVVSAIYGSILALHVIWITLWLS